MLAITNRLTSREDFSRTTRSSIRANTPSLVGYLLKEKELTAPKVGYIVSRSVGSAVLRHRITRQLRHATKDALGLLPEQALAVVRAKKQPNAQQEIPHLFQELAERSKKTRVDA